MSEEKDWKPGDKSIPPALAGYFNIPSTSDRGTLCVPPARTREGEPVAEEPVEEEELETDNDNETKVTEIIRALAGEKGASYTDIMTHCRKKGRKG